MGGVIWQQGKPVHHPMPTDLPAWMSAAGGGFSTAADLAQLMIVHLSQGELGDRQIIAANALQATHQTSFATNFGSPWPEWLRTGYGMGWFTEAYRGERLVTHGGNFWAVSNQMGLLPQRRLGVVVLVNEDSSLLTYVIMRIIFDRFMGVDNRDWVQEWSTRRPAHQTAQATSSDPDPQGSAAATPLPAGAAEYAGTYRHPGYGTVSVHLVSDSLTAHRSDQTSGLRHVSGDIFEATTREWTSVWAPEGTRARLQFSRDFQGRVSGLRISSAGTITFERIADYDRATVASLHCIRRCEGEPPPGPEHLHAARRPLRRTRTAIAAAGPCAAGSPA